MGNSNLGRHADGPQLYGKDAVWPPEWRKKWNDVRAEAERRFRPPPRLGTSSNPGTPLKRVLADAGLAGALRKLAARSGVDEADVARIWSACDGGDALATAQRVGERLKLIRSFDEAIRSAAKSERLRTPVATRAHLRTLAVSAALSLEGSRTEAAKRFLRRALPERIG